MNDDEEKLIVFLVQRIVSMVVSWSKQIAGPVQDLARQDELRKQHVSSLLQLCTTKSNSVAFSLLQAFNSLNDKYKSESEEDLMALARARVFFIDLLALCLAFNWNSLKKKANATEESMEELGKKKANASSEAEAQEILKQIIQLKQREEQVLPLSLDEQLSNKLIDVACRYLLAGPGPHLGQELREKAGLLFFQLSAYNWDTVIGRVSSGVSNQDETTTPWNLLENLNLNSARLSQLLIMVAGAVEDGIFKKTNMQVLLARILVRAIWNWIDHYPMEFLSFCQKGTRLRGEPDKLFDTYVNWGGKKKNGDFWEVQTMLLILCPDIMFSVARASKESGKEVATKEKFMQNLNKALNKNTGKLADVAAICYVDICKASTFVSKQDTHTCALRYIVPAIETDLKGCLFNHTTLFRTSQGNEVPLMTNCLLASFRLSPRKVVKELFAEFLQPDHAPIFKLVLINTLQLIVDEGASLPWNPTIQDVYAGLSQQLRALFQEYELQTRGYSELARLSDRRARAQQDRMQKDIEILTRLVNLFYSDPMLPLTPSNKSAAADLEETQNLLTGLCTLTSLFALPEVSQAAGNALLALHRPEHIDRWCTLNVLHGFWHISSAINSSLSNVLVERRDLRTVDIHQLVSILNQILGERNVFLARIHKHKDRKPSADSGEPGSRALSSTQLEIALLIHLCSAETEIVSKVVNCFGKLCDEIDIVGESESENSILVNYLVYRKLANSSNPGRAAQQRAIRIELRRIRQTAGNFSAWEQVHQRWTNLTAYILRGGEEVKTGTDYHATIKKLAKIANAKSSPAKTQARTTTTLPPVAPEKYTEWNHFAGFLCAAAGVAFGKEQVKVEQTRKDKTETKVKVADMFIREILKLIVLENDMIRETTTELAGSTLSPAVYSVLFHHLNRKVRKLFGQQGQIKFDKGTSTPFVDQAISIVKHIMELPVDTHTGDDLALLVDIEELITNLVKYVSGLVSKENPSLALRIRHKMCGCLEAMMAKQQFISFNDEKLFRQSLVELIMEWISDFSAKPRYKPAASFEGAVLSEEKRKEAEKLIQDVDVAAVKAISALLRRLPLPKEDTDGETSALKKYFTFFTNLIGRAKSDATEAAGQAQSVKAEHAVAALSNLLSANIDSALEYFVTMGYHEDLETRAAFLKVLTNILNQGAEFDSGTEGGRYDKLLELIIEPKMDVVLALSSVIQITEADDVAQLLVRLFEANERTMDLLRKAIKQEVWKTETENTLFRRNSMATKLLAAYSKLIGTRYLRDTLTPVLQFLISKPPPLELDPAKLAPGQDRGKNIENVTRVSGDFLRAIVMSTENCPLPFREICNFLKTQVGKRFPGAEHSAIGGFFMLRFLCPAIVAPDGFALVPPVALSPELRRGLVLTTKVLQNLANKVMFNKEPHMEEMNVFLKENMNAIEALFDEMAKVPEDGEPATPLHVPEEQREEDLANLHYHLSVNLDKIQKVLDAESERKSNVFLRLTALLGQLGPPPEPSRNTKFSNPTDISSKKGTVNAHHTDYMNEHANVNIAPLEAAKIFYKQGQTKNKAAVFYFIARKMENTWSQHQLVVHIMKTLQSELGKPFSIVVDLTLFNKDHEITPSWISRFRQVAPNVDTLDKIFLLHANYDFKKYSKKVAKLVSRVRSKLVLVSSVKELQAFIPERELALPTSTLAVERDVRATFSPVQKLMPYNNQKEVVVKVSNSLFEVVTAKQHNIFGHRVSLVDLLHIASIVEINVAEDTSEFVLKYDKDDLKTATYRTPASEQIIMAIRASKASYNLSKTEESVTAKRSFRAADVPGTLLNMALLNLGNTNAELRVEAYNLLAALCSSFNLSVQSSLYETSGLCIPRNTSTFIESLSRKLAETSCNMTLEFLQEALHGIEKIKANLPGKQLSLNYITYWLPNLRLYVRPSPHPDALANMEKTRSIVTQFIEFTIRETSMTGPAIQAKVWEVIGQVPEVLDTVIDCLLERANDKKQGGPGSTSLFVIGDIFVSLASQNARLVAGKLLSKLLHVLSLTNGAKVNRLDEHPVWPNIVVLLRVLLMLSFENLLCVADYLPELFFVVLLLFSTGASIVRATVHGLLINIVHSLYTSLSQGTKLQALRLLLSELDQQKTRVLFGLGGLSISAFSKQPEKNTSLDGASMSITTVETVVNTLLSVLNYCSPTNNCVGTAWHSRLLSLSTRMAYTSNAALQPRAIIALGVLCHSPVLVTDELMSKVLRTLLEVFSSLFSTGQKLDADLPLSLIICITRLFEHVSSRSKFFKPMFWLAITLLEIDEPSLFSVAISLMEVVLKTLDSYDCFADGIVAYCMTAREECSLEEVLSRADQLTGISFKTSFSFAIAAHLLKGLRRPATKTATARVLSTFVDIAAKKAIGSSMLGYIATLLPVKGDEMDNLRQLLLPAGEASSLHQYLFTEQMLPDTLNAALLFTLLVTILKSSDSEHEQQFIYEALKEGVLIMPEAFPVIYDVLIPKMSYVIQNSQNPQIIEACLSIMKSMFSPNMEVMTSKKRMNKDYLASKAAFQGLLDADTFHKPGPKTEQLVKITCAVVEQMFRSRNI
eukprot:TRINITY_DN1115_c0_g1_i1.p1 TRINITY_DN1115_c0_g1~~TRINITY_DN1115_c0_g1_i1.p1  ORF type:complete len:2561 (-),score=353.59 TRINITY_DN1115_c0_g1_i1:117-7799(-)